MNLEPLFNSFGVQQRAVFNTVDLMVLRAGAIRWRDRKMTTTPKGVPTGLSVERQQIVLVDIGTTTKTVTRKVKVGFKMRRIVKAETDEYIRSRGRNRLTIRLYLDCGHDVYRQERRGAAYEQGGKARCYECGGEG